MKMEQVYFIKNKENGLVKIGMSKNAPKRIKQLESSFNQLGIKCDLEVLKIINVHEAGRLELDLHKLFRDSRVRGEWFSNLNLRAIEKALDKLRIEDYVYQDHHVTEINKQRSLKSMESIDLDKRYIKDQELEKLYPELNHKELLIIAKFRRAFPMLCLNKLDGMFVISGQYIWSKISLAKEGFSTWVSREVNKEDYKENIDYTKKEIAIKIDNCNLTRVENEYMFTPFCAKRIILNSKSEHGSNAKLYFSIMERLLRQRMIDFLGDDDEEPEVS